jgi:predicted enzyme related to lactoylglutathione lyase
MTATAVIYVSDLGQMLTFYTRCFGLQVLEEQADFALLSGEQWELILVLVPQEVGEQIRLRKPSARREHNPVKLGFAVDNITALRPLVDGLGGSVDGPSTEWDFRGGRRCDATDPEGNVFQLRSRSEG